MSKPSNRIGRKMVQGRVGHLDDEMIEALESMRAAYPEPVPFERMHHLTNGTQADKRNVANTIMRIRRMFGAVSVELIRADGTAAKRGTGNNPGIGYRVTPAMFAAVARMKRRALERRVGRALIRVLREARAA